MTGTGNYASSLKVKTQLLFYSGPKIQAAKGYAHNCCSLLLPTNHLKRLPENANKGQCVTLSPSFMGWYFGSLPILNIFPFYVSLEAYLSFSLELGALTTPHSNTKAGFTDKQCLHLQIIKLLTL